MTAHRNSGRTLSIWSTATTDGANAVQWVENNGGDQQWQLVPAGAYYKLVNRHAGKALAVWEASTSDGARVVQWPDTGALDQQWQLVQVSG